MILFKKKIQISSFPPILNDSCSLQLPLGNLMRVICLTLPSKDVNGIGDKSRRIGEKAGLGRAGMEGREEEG